MSSANRQWLSGRFHRSFTYLIARVVILTISIFIAVTVRDIFDRKNNVLSNYSVRFENRRISSVEEMQSYAPIFFNDFFLRGRR